MNMLLKIADSRLVRQPREEKAPGVRSALKMSLILVALLLVRIQTVSADSEDEKKFQSGIDYFNDAQFSQAHSFFNEVKPDLESNAEFNYYYGLTLLLTDNVKEAVEVMLRAIEIAPDNAEYHFALARIYETRQREISVFRMPSVARSYKRALRKAIELDPQHAGATRTLANILLTFPSILGGDSEAGQALLLKLRDLDRAAAFLVEANSIKDEDFERAEELLLMAINTAESSVAIQATVTLGRLYIKHEQYSKAIPILDQSLTLPWDWSETNGINERHIHLAGSYHLLGDEINARKYALVAEEIALTQRDRKELGYWFDRWNMK